MTSLPEPECELGYPYHQVAKILDSDERLEAFATWMGGQTMSLCNGWTFDYKTNVRQETGCGPHGSVVYAVDLRRWLAGLPNID